MSLGNQQDPTQDSIPCPSDEQRAIDYAVARGAIVVAAGGNSGLSGSPVEDPGVCLGVVSVGAIDSHGVVAPFSSRHPYLTLVAPGIGIASLGRVPGAAYLGDGTSQATAITSAALALVWSKHPSLTGREIVTRVLATLKHRAPTHDLAYGYGALAVRPAVLAAVPANAANPVYDALVPFLDREHARTAAASRQPAPQPAATTNAPPGKFQAGAEPGTFSGPVLAGTVAALVGIAVLAVLGGMAWASRRRSPSPAPMPPPPAWPTESAGVRPPEWQDITGPIWPFAPPPSQRIR
jgi:hypothetical protein